MRGVLVQIQPWNRQKNARELLSLGSALNPNMLGLNSIAWQSILTSRPTFKQEIFDDDLTGALVTGSGMFSFNFERITGVDYPQALEYDGAPITIWSSAGPAAADMITEFVGRVSDSRPDREKGVVSISFEVDRKIVDVPLLNILYTGGGGSGGDAELAGTFVPAAFGSPRNVEPVLVNQVARVYQADGYGNLTSFAGVYEDAAPFPASVGNFSSYANLVAASIPEGKYGTCNALGMFRLGAPPTGVITCDPVCGANRPGSLALRWLQTHAAIAVGKIRTTDFDALTTAYNYPVSHYTQSQDNVMSLVTRLLSSCNSMLVLALDGKIGCTRMFGGATLLTLQRKGGTPRVLGMPTLKPATPWWRMKMSAAKNYRVHTATEIDYEDDIILMGNYVGSETYRQGHVVRWTDGAMYLYTNATPSSGNAPPNATYWSFYMDAADALDVRYQDGTPLENLKPSTPNADGTGAAQIDLQVPPEVFLQATSAGVLTTALPFTIRCKMVKNSVDISATTGFSITLPSGLTGSINNTPSDSNRGVITITAVASNYVSANIAVSATAAGYGAQNKQCTVTKQNAPPDVSGGSGATASNTGTMVTNSINSGTHTTLSAVISLASDAAGAIKYSAFSQYYSGGGETVALKIQYATAAAGPWNDIAAEGPQGSASYIDPYYGFVNSGAASIPEATKTGLTPSTVYYFRLQGRRVSGAGSITLQTIYLQVRQ